MSTTAKKLTVGRGMNRRVTKAGQAMLDGFNARIETELRALGAKPSGHMYPWSIETKAGTLLVSLHGSWVACRFEDVARARELLGVKERELFNRAGLNPFTGKWNFHYDIEDLETAVIHFLTHLREVLP